VPEHLHAYDALILPAGYGVTERALTGEPFSSEEIGSMARHVRLVDELSRCRYFTTEERSLHVTMDEGVTTNFEMTLPDAGATRDMLALLRQLFGDKERASVASMMALLRSHANKESDDGRTLDDVLRRFDLLKQGVLDSWDVQRGGTENKPQPPLNVFLDWMYGEYLHSDGDKAQRISELDGPHRLYEWQFHWVVERLALLFERFARLVRATLVDQVT
jgi:hypothetical protein